LVALDLVSAAVQNKVRTMHDYLLFGVGQSCSSVRRSGCVISAVILGIAVRIVRRSSLTG
jgi:hypothetical protein